MQSSGGKLQRTVGPLRGVQVVGDQHQRGAMRVALLQQQFQHLGGMGRVKIAGGLIGQQQRRLVNQRPGDRHALHLAAR